MAGRGPKPKQQGLESLPGTTMWPRDNFGSKILSQGRKLNEQLSQESQMFFSTCFGAEIIFFLGGRNNLYFRTNGAFCSLMEFWVLGKCVIQNVRQASHPKSLLLTPPLQVTEEELINTNQMHDLIFPFLPGFPALLACAIST